MSLKSKKRVLIAVGLVLFALGWVAYGVGSIPTDVHHGPHGGKLVAAVNLSGWGILCIVIGFFTALWGVLKGNVPKWVA